jgi:hypothetical protein
MSLAKKTLQQESCKRDLAKRTLKKEPWKRNLEKGTLQKEAQTKSSEQLHSVEKSFALQASFKQD